MLGAHGFPPGRPRDIVINFPSYISHEGKHVPERWMHAYTQLGASHEIFNHLAKKKQYITQLEMVAAVAAYTTFGDLLTNRKAVHWIDNQGALAGLIKGYGRDSDCAKLLHAQVAISLITKTCIWYAYIASEANIADLPSRGDLEYLTTLGSEERALVIPELDGWESTAERFENDLKKDLRGKRHRSAGRSINHHRVRRNTHAEYD